MKKIIGTSIPLSSLYSKKFEGNKHGTLDEAYIFLDWLKSSKQNAWQLLPLHETYASISPYKGYGIGLDPKYIAYTDTQVLDKEKFIEENEDWVFDYARFCVLRDKYRTDHWWEWQANNVSEKESEKYINQQFNLHNQFFALRKKAKSLDIKLIGDMPFYLPITSPLVFFNREIFDIEEYGGLRYTSGVPDIYNSHFGRQVWGHPLYKLDESLFAEKITTLFKLRIKYLASLFDIVRLDHATGFFYYGCLDLTGRQPDVFKKGPGGKVLEELVMYSRSLGMDVIVDDSANRRYREMQETLERLKVPVSRLIRFAFNEKLDKLIEHNADIENYPENIAAYTTTHDTETLISYLALLGINQKKVLAKKAGLSYMGNDEKFALDLRNAVIFSRARIVIIPLQDWYLLKDRINTPGTEKARDDINWRFRMKIPIEDLSVDLF